MEVCRSTNGRALRIAMAPIRNVYYAIGYAESNWNDVSLPSAVLPVGHPLIFVR